MSEQDRPPKSPHASSRVAAKAAKRVEMANRRKQVAALLLARWQQKDIAEKLGIHYSEISRMATALKAEWAVEHREDIAKAQNHELAALAQDEARIRSSLASLAGEKHKERVAYQEVLLKIMAARAKILGTDKPEKIEITGNVEKPLTIEYVNDWKAGAMVAPVAVAVERAATGNLNGHANGNGHTNGAS